MNKFSKLFKYKYFIFLIFILVFTTILAMILVLNINSVKNTLLTASLLLLWALLSFFIIKYLCLKLINKIIYLKNTWKIESRFNEDLETVKNELETKFNNDLDTIKKDMETKFANDLDTIKKDMEMNLIKYITITHFSKTSFISATCRAGEMYKYLQIQHKSPFIYILMDNEVFGNFLQNLEFNINQPLTFVSLENCTTRYENTKTLDHYIPIAYFGDPSLEIHFTHDTSDQKVLEKWNRRKERMNYERVITINAPEEYKNKFYRNIQLKDDKIIITKNNKDFTFYTRKQPEWENFWEHEEIQMEIISKSLEMLLLLI